MDWGSIGIGAGVSVVDTAIAAGITALVGGNVLLVSGIIGVTAFIVGTSAMRIVKTAAEADEACERMLREVNE